MAKTRILVENGKHGTYFYDATTDEQWAAACVSILTERLDYYIYKPDDPRDNADKSWASPSTEDFEWAERTVPADLEPELAAPLQKKIDKAKQKVTSAMANYERELVVYNAIKSVVEKKDTSMVTRGQGRYERQEPRAWVFILERNDYEYERVDLEYPTDPLAS